MSQIYVYSTYFNKEKTLVGAFSMIEKSSRTYVCSSTQVPLPRPPQIRAPAEVCCQAQVEIFIFIGRRWRFIFYHRPQTYITLKYWGFRVSATFICRRKMAQPPIPPSWGHGQCTLCCRVPRCQPCPGLTASRGSVECRVRDFMWIKYLHRWRFLTWIYRIWSVLKYNCFYKIFIWIKYWNANIFAGRHDTLWGCILFYNCL